MDKTPCNSQDVEVRKGPWTMEEDLILINYIANNGRGVWNSLAKAAGLKRTGKSCRLRWLNYLRPDVRRGNITPEEQLLIMDLHAKWGNRAGAHIIPVDLYTPSDPSKSHQFYGRWSTIAKHLPGRTDNEIKNFWRTRIHKHNKQAETFSGQSSEANEQASSSQVSTEPYAMDSYSPPSYQVNMDQQFFPMVPLPAEANENYWSIEDLWLLNGD